MANLVFNEAALNFLLQDPAGPVGRRLNIVANHIAGRYEAVIDVVWEMRDPFLKPQVDYDIVNADFGLEAVIGITDGGSISQEMADKMVDEQERLLGPIMQTWEVDV